LDGDLGLIRLQVRVENQTELSHVAAARSIPTWLRITKLTDVPIANAYFLQRFREHAFRKARAARLGQLTHIK